MVGTLFSSLEFGRAFWKELVGWGSQSRESKAEKEVKLSRVGVESRSSCSWHRDVGTTGDSM